MDSTTNRVLYFVKCPHCGADIVFRFDHIRWSTNRKGELKEVGYLCNCCRAKITEQQKNDVLLVGEWREVEISKVHCAINPLMLINGSYADIVKAFLHGRKTELGTKAFVACWLIGQ